MAEKNNKEIADSYGLYSHLLDTMKYSNDSEIVLLSGEGGKAKYMRVHAHPLSMEDEVSANVALEVQQKKTNGASFKFKLKSEQLSQQPFFRYDSDGSTHKNKDPNIPLNEQAVPTPHFNCFDSEGRNIAYRTDYIETNDVSDINVAFKYYCQVAKICLSESRPEEFSVITVGEIFSPVINKDPLSSVNFEID